MLERARSLGGVRLWALVAALSAACSSGQPAGGAAGAAGGGGATGAAGTSGRGGGAGTGAAGAGAAGASGGAGPGAAGTGGAAGGSSGASGGTAGAGGAAAGGGSAGTGAGGTGAGGSAAGGTTGAAGAAGTGGGAAGSGAAGSAAGGGGAGGTAAATGCTHKLCEDFESGTVGGLPTGWTALAGYGNGASQGVGLATDPQAHSGTMVLKSNSMMTGQERAQKSLAALGATATKHWGRIFYKVQSPAPKPSSGNVIHVTFTALQGTTENRVVDTVEMSNGTHQWLFNIPDDSCCTQSTYDWTFDSSWHCAEWYVDVSAESYRFFSDGTEVTALAFTGNAGAKMSSYTAVAVGAIFYQAPPSPFVISFDDLAIDDHQIGCQ